MVDFNDVTNEPVDSLIIRIVSVKYPQQSLHLTNWQAYLAQALVIPKNINLRPNSMSLSKNIEKGVQKQFIIGN